jgi:hypothetical protein
VTDQQLMQKIKADTGSAIAVAVQGSPVPLRGSFVAALVANESSGDPTVTRFEPGVFAELAQVLAGRKTTYGSIDAATLSPILGKAGMTANPLASITGKILDFATSWGFTQIMGYQTIGYGMTIADLLLPPQHFQLCVKILAAFTREWKQINPSSNPDWCADLFRCWNTGRPDGQTTDPDYVAKGLSRMNIYQGLV